MTFSKDTWFGEIFNNKTQRYQFVVHLISIMESHYVYLLGHYPS